MQQPCTALMAPAMLSPCNPINELNSYRAQDSRHEAAWIIELPVLARNLKGSDRP